MLMNSQIQMIKITIKNIKWGFKTMEKNQSIVSVPTVGVSTECNETAPLITVNQIPPLPGKWTRLHRASFLRLRTTTCVSRENITITKHPKTVMTARSPGSHANCHVGLGRQKQILPPLLFYLSLRNVCALEVPQRGALKRPCQWTIWQERHR